MGGQYIPMTDSARGSLIGICVLWVLYAVVMVFRVLGRYRGVGIGFDDVLGVVAFLLTTSTIGFNAAVFVSGVGYNMDPSIPEYPKRLWTDSTFLLIWRYWDLLANTEFIMQITFTFTLIYLWSLASLKLSQLCFYWRAFSVKLKSGIYVVSAIVVAWGLSFTFVFIFLCNPVQQQWTLERIGHCMDQVTVLKCIIMTNVVTDLLIVALPIRTVWELQMRKTERLAVIACFALGLGCCVIGIVRFWQIFVIDLTGNLTGTSLTTFMLCTVELMLAGLCISIPMLRPFYLRWRLKYKSSQLSHTYGQASHKASQSKNLGQDRPVNYNTWIELNEDQENGSNDDGSERRLTREQHKAGIHVQKDWVVTKG